MILSQNFEKYFEIYFVKYFAHLIVIELCSVNTRQINMDHNRIIQFILIPFLSYSYLKFFQLICTLLFIRIVIVNFLKYFLKIYKLYIPAFARSFACMSIHHR